MKFFNLHQHTTYSFLDGYGTPEQIADRLNIIDQEGCAITDHGNIYSHVPFVKEFKKTNKHLVFGCEFYIREKIEAMKGYFHVTVLAKNNNGYQNLLKLVNLSNKQFYYKPRITFEQLAKNSKGLIILSGCFCDGWFIKNPAGEEQWLKWFKNSEWYIELQPFKDLQERWNQIVDIANRRGLPCVVTFDSHYPSLEDKTVHDFMLAINTNRPLADPDRLKLDYPLHMLNINEVVHRCREMKTYKEEWITCTYDIAMKCDVELPKTSMIKLDVTIESIQAECRAVMKKMKLDKKEEYTDRLEYELRLIKEKNFMDYFEIISDLMKWAKTKMLCSPGRGSSAGSLVCYLLGITEVDPIKFGTLFERFIDLNRKDLPDIDLDFPASQREEVIEYFKTKYGKDKTVQLVTFNTFKPKAIIQDGARVLKIPHWEAKESTSQMIERSGGDSRAEFCLNDSIQQYDKLKSFFDKYPKLYDAVNLEGQIRQIGKHAAAVAIASDPLEKIGAIKDDILSIDKYSTEDVGLLKIDVLGLETLDVIQDICKEVKFDFNEFYKIPLDDKTTFENVFTNARLIGVFQFEGKSVRKVCEDIKPTIFDHLVHITALGRPGPLNSGSTRDYIKRFNGEKYEIDPILKPYTKDTLGIIIFQEQVMNVVKNIGKLSWEDTSSIRKAMSKNLGEEYFNKYKNKFIKGAKDQGIDAAKAESIFKSIYTFGSWAFNLSHAVSYALLSYWIGYCKAHWPEYFYARILKNKTEPLEIIPVLKEFGGKFISLDINKSKKYFSTDGKVLIGGFTNIKGIGDAAAQKIINGQPYESIEDFKSRVPNGIANKVETAIVHGQPWEDFSPMKSKVNVEDIKLTAPLRSFHEIMEGQHKESIALGRVVLVNLKDHNEEEKVQKRGYKMKGFTEFAVLKVQDDDFNIWHVCFDRDFTARHKQLLLSTNGKICLFKVIKSSHLLLIGKKVKIVEKE